MMKYTLPFLILFVSLFTVRAQSEADFILLQKDYVWNTDGSSEIHCRQVIRYNTHVSFNRLYGETFIVYNPAYQKLKINESYTVQASGNKITAPDNAFNEVLPRFAADAPDYNGLREMVVTHTGLEIGAVSYLDYTLYTKAGYLPELDQCLPLQEDSPVKEYKISVRIPDSKNLSYQSYLLKGDPKIKKGNGTVSYEWSFRNIAPSSKEYYQPSDGSNAPHLVFSTWSSQEKALQWLSGQMQAGDVSGVRDMISKFKSSHSDPYRIAVGAYDDIIKRIAYTPVPPEYAGYQFRNASQVFKSAYGTSGEKSILLIALAKGLGIQAYPVCVYPSFMDRSVGSLHAIKDFAVYISEQGQNFVLSPVKYTPFSMNISQPGYRYVAIASGMTDIPVSSVNKAVLSMNIDLKDRPEYTGQLSLTGSFNPMLAVWLDENKAKKLLSGITADQISGLSPGEHTFYTNMEGKLQITENSGYYTLMLPETNGGVNSWNMKYLNTKRKSNAEIPYKIEESYTYFISLPHDKKIVNRSENLNKTNRVGKVKIEVKLLPSNCLELKRSIQIEKDLISPSDYDDFTELLKIWESNNYRMIVYK